MTITWKFEQLPGKARARFQGPLNAAGGENIIPELVRCTIDDGLCRLTLNRPEKLNALAADSFREIDRHLDRAE